MYMDDYNRQAIVKNAVSNIFPAMANRYSINWTVKAQKNMNTAFFHMDSGTSIGVLIKLSKKAKAGIIGGDGLVRYVEGTEIIHSFSISKSQPYGFIILNNNDVAITATGYYIH